MARMRRESRTMYRDTSGRFASKKRKTRRRNPAKAASAKRDDALLSAISQQAEVASAAAKVASEAAASAKATAKKKAPSRRRKPYTAAELRKKSKTARKTGSRYVDRGLKAVHNQRASTLALRARAKSGQLSKKAKEAMRAHGLTRVNPGFKTLKADLKALAGPVFASAVSAWGVTKLGCMAKEASAKAQSPFMQKYGVAFATGGATIGAYVAARMAAPKYASAVLMGGTAATVVQVITAMSKGNISAAQDNSLQGYIGAAPSAESQGSPYTSSVGEIPSVEDFANPYAYEVLEEDPTGSLSGSIF